MALNTIQISGVGGNRTLVQTRRTYAFFMLSPGLIVGSGKAPKRAITTTYQLNFANSRCTLFRYPGEDDAPTINSRESLSGTKASNTPY